MIRTLRSRKSTMTLTIGTVQGNLAPVEISPGMAVTAGGSVYRTTKSVTVIPKWWQRLLSWVGFKIIMKIKVPVEE